MPGITMCKRIPIMEATWGITTMGIPIRRMIPMTIPMNISMKMGMHTVKPGMCIKDTIYAVDVGADLCVCPRMDDLYPIGG